MEETKVSNSRSGEDRRVGEHAHVKRIAWILGAAVLAGLVLQWFLRPAGYGEHGSYRQGVLADIFAQEPVHTGKKICGECHEDVYRTHQKDIHFDVQCEDCHGPGGEHVRAHRDGPPAADNPARLMPKEYTLEGCLFCHRRLAARPRDFPQIDPSAHYRFLAVKDPETRCIRCHSPHEPIFLLTEVREARVHPILYECTYCHEQRPEKSHRDVKEHPVIFGCIDCHEEIVKDFTGRRHGFMECTSCHLFHRENEVAGRIFKNGNRRFCLLCHEKQPFREEGKIPGIDSGAHLADFAEALGMDAEELAAEPRACLRCHLKEIHRKKLIGK